MIGKRFSLGIEHATVKNEATYNNGSLTKKTD